MRYYDFTKYMYYSGIIKSIKEENIMAYVISDDCVMCGACQAQCPADAISEGEGKYVINADACIDCGGCAAQCPAEAIAQA